MTSSSAATPIPTKIPKKVDEIEALGIDKGDLLEGARPWLEGVSDIKDNDGLSDKIAMQMSIDPEEHGPLTGGKWATPMRNVESNMKTMCPGM